MLRAVFLVALGLYAGPAAAQTPVAAQAAEAGLGTATKAADTIILAGPLGALFILVVVGLLFALGGAGVVIRALWNTIKERDAATEAMRKDYDAAIATLQDRRAAELVENTKEVARTAISGSAAITASNERLADTAARVQTLAERVISLPDAFARVESRVNEIARTCGRGAA